MASRQNCKTFVSASNSCGNNTSSDNRSKKRTKTSTTTPTHTKKSPNMQTSLESYFNHGSNNITANINTTAMNRSLEKRYISTVRNSATVFLSNGQPSAFGTCPICENTNIPIHRLAVHASQCNGKLLIRPPQEPVMVNNDNSSSIQEKPSEPSMEYHIPNTAVTGTNHVAVVNSPQKFSLDNSTQDETSGDLLPQPPLQCTEPVPGLFVYENFLTEQEEEQILLQLDDPTLNDNINPWKAATFNGKHYGQRWGVHCNLKARQVFPAERELPKFYHETILPKLQDSSSGVGTSLSLSKLKGCIPNEMNSISYYKSLGHSLSAHVDDRSLSKEVILNLSLGGDCYMTFTPVVAAKSETGAVALSKPKREIRVLLKRRCLQILSGSARYHFTHSIFHHDLLSERRVSLTLRESPITTTNTKIKSVGTMMTAPKGKSATFTRNTRPTLKVPSNPYRQSPTTPNSIVATIPSSITSLSWVKTTLSDDEPTGLTISKAKKRDEKFFNDTLVDVPPGLFIFPDFITEQEENEIIRQLDQTESLPQWSLERHTGTHREKRWGLDHDLWSRQVRDPIHKIPEWTETMIIQRLKLLRLQSEYVFSDAEEKAEINTFRNMMRDFAPNDVNAIEYKRDNGHSLGAHVDDRQKHIEPIVNLSLAGDCYMEYTTDPHSKRIPVSRRKTLSNANSTSRQNDDVMTEIYRVYLPRRTLQLLTGRARYDYQHGIHNTDLCSTRRISITLRETRS